MPVPGLGQVDDRELQALAAVHGQDRDRLGVGLQPPGARRSAPLPRASAIRLRSHSTSAPTPSWPADHGARAGSGRGAAGRSAGARRRCAASSRSGTPLVGGRRLQQGGDPRLGQHPAPPADPLGELGQLGSRRPAASSAKVQPTKQVSAACRTACCRGCSSAISRVSQSWAIGEANTELAPCITAGTPAATRASRIASPRSLVRTSTAMSAGCTGPGPFPSTPAARPQASSGGDVGDQVGE